MYISKGMKIATKWMNENNVIGDADKLKYHSIGHLLTKFADDLINKNDLLHGVINSRLSELEEENRLLKLIIENGIGAKDLENDCL